MVNGNLGDYWQAGAGRQGKNWIRIYVKPNVIVHRLDVDVLPVGSQFRSVVKPDGFWQNHRASVMSTRKYAFEVNLHKTLNK